MVNFSFELVPIFVMKTALQVATASVQPSLSLLRTQLVVLAMEGQIRCSC